MTTTETNGTTSNPVATYHRKIAAQHLALAATLDGLRPEAYGGAYDALTVAARVDAAVTEAVEQHVGPALDAFEARIEERIAYLESLLGATPKPS